MSQPRPRPCFASVSANVLSEPMRTRWNSCWREYGKCSHRLLLTAMPRRASSDLSTCVRSELQPPHEVAALVAVLSAPTVVLPASIAAQITPLVTLLHEQICALAGRPAAPRPTGSLTAPNDGTTIAAGSPV